MHLVLDSGGVSTLAEGSHRATALLAELSDRDHLPPVVPAAVLVECLRGDPASDAVTNRLLKACEIVVSVPVRLARRAAYLRTHAGRGSAIDALVVATAEPGGSVLTTDPKDLEAIAAHALEVAVVSV